MQRIVFIEIEVKAVIMYSGNKKNRPTPSTINLHILSIIDKAWHKLPRKLCE